MKRLFALCALVGLAACTHTFTLEPTPPTLPPAPATEPTIPLVPSIDMEAGYMAAVCEDLALAVGPHEMGVVLKAAGTPFVTDGMTFEEAVQHLAYLIDTYCPVQAERIRQMADI